MYCVPGPAYFFAGPAASLHAVPFAKTAHGPWGQTSTPNRERLTDLHRRQWHCLRRNAFFSLPTASPGPCSRSAGSGPEPVLSSVPFESCTGRWRPRSPLPPMGCCRLPFKIAPQPARNGAVLVLSAGTNEGDPWLVVAPTISEGPMLHQLSGDPHLVGGVFGFALGGLFGYALRSMISFHRRQLYRRRGY